MWHSNNRTRLVISLGLRSTQETLMTLHQVASKVSLAEVRLDLMSEFDIAYLLSESPCDLILTNRPIREGGRFVGSEKERLAPLIEGIRLGVSHVDIEWDSIDLLLKLQDKINTKLIVSHHNSNEMPADMIGLHERLSRSGADIIKLVGRAQTASDTTQVLKLLSQTTFPTIALAMGSIGLPSRLLCLKSPSCYLSYVSITAASKTAPGQISLDDALQVFNGLHFNDQTKPFCLITPAGQYPGILTCLNQEFSRQALNATCIPLHLGEEALMDVLDSYQALAVQGYSIATEYQKTAYHSVDDLDASAKSSKSVNTIARIEGVLVGFWLDYSKAEELAYQQVTLWSEIHRCNTKNLTTTNRSYAVASYGLSLRR